MDKSDPKAHKPAGFPRVDRSVIEARGALGDSDEREFWLSKTPLERLEALELLREIAFGHDATTARLQRIPEVTEFPPR